jgi:hypothetical protein
VVEALVVNVVNVVVVVVVVEVIVEVVVEVVVAGGVVEVVGARVVVLVAGVGDGKSSTSKSNSSALTPPPGVATKTSRVQGPGGVPTGTVNSHRTHLLKVSWLNCFVQASIGRPAAQRKKPVSGSGWK